MPLSPSPVLECPSFHRLLALCVHPLPTRCCFTLFFLVISVCFAIKYLSSVPTSLILRLSLSISQATSVNLAALLSLIELNVLCNLSPFEPLHRSIIVYLGLFITFKMFAFHSSNSFFPFVLYPSRVIFHTMCFFDNLLPAAYFTPAGSLKDTARKWHL